MTYSFRPYHGPGVDSAPSENEYQEHFWGKGGRCVRLTTSPNSRAECHEIWESKPPETLWDTPGPLRDSFTFTFTHICQKANRHQDHKAAGRMKSKRNFYDSIEPATFRHIVQCLNRLRHHAHILSNLRISLFTEQTISGELIIS